MRVTPFHLWIFLAGACAVIALGATMLRYARTRVPGGVAVGAGLAAIAFLALAQLTGRLGQDHLWFRAPTFYVAALILLGALMWWLTRPIAVAWRFGLPAALLALLAVAGVLTRFDGRSAPLAMLMPTFAQPAPDLSFFDEAGRVRHLSEFRGKVVLVNFWATWCTPCRREMPMLSRLQREHGDDGLVVLYLSLEEPAVLAPFLATNHFDGVHGRIEGAPGFYDAGKYYPLSYLITRDGRVTRRWSGRPQEEWLRAELARALREGRA
jgi:thiol-disulfide isomerase/thioredoxin